MGHIITQISIHTILVFAITEFLKRVYIGSNGKRKYIITLISTSITMYLQPFGWSYIFYAFALSYSLVTPPRLGRIHIVLACVKVTKIYPFLGKNIFPTSGRVENAEALRLREGIGTKLPPVSSTTRFVDMSWKRRC